MATVHFTLNLRRHLDCPECQAAGTTVREVMHAVFTAYPKVKDYILDERGGVRKHMAIFVDGQAVIDRDTLSDGVGAESEIYVMQALTGG